MAHQRQSSPGKKGVRTEARTAGARRDAREKVDEIATRIAEARKRAGYSTIAAFHRRTCQVDGTGKGISQPVLAGYEAGKFLPGTRELKLLCEALDASPNWLLFGRQSFGAPNVASDYESFLAALFETANADQRMLYIAPLFASLLDRERRAVLQMMEVLLRARMGDERFAALIELVKTTAELTFGSQSLLKDAGPQMLQKFLEGGAQSTLQRLKQAAQNVGLRPEDLDPTARNIPPDTSDQ